jgi:hypothetical protein
MAELLRDPLVQWGALPFAAGLVAAAILFPLRLAGLAAAAGVAAAVAATGGFGIEPLSVARKVVVAGAVAALFGALADLAFRPTRSAGVVLGALFAGGALWVFAAVLRQKIPAEVAIVGAGIAGFAWWLVAATVSLHHDTVRAGAAGLALGLGAGFAASLGASALLAQYGVALGAGSGAFLLLAMILGGRVEAGAALTLTASVLAALIATGAALLGKLHWLALLPLALVPLAVRLPLPRGPAWMQALLATLYAGVAGAGAPALAWLAARGWRL